MRALAGLGELTARSALVPDPCQITLALAPLVAVIVGLVLAVAAGHLAPDPLRDPAVTAP